MNSTMRVHSLPAIDLSVLPDRSIAIVLGTRPEIIKLAGVLRLLGSKARLIHTSQHYDPAMSTVFFEQFCLPHPELLLDVGGHSRAQQIGLALTALDEHLTGDRPLAVVVQGDTNATLAGALAANARRIPLVHVEAGLRSHDRRMPEEHNRILTDQLADLLCAPTALNVANLAAQGIAGDRVILTGNTVVEAVQMQLPAEPARRRVLSTYNLSADNYVLATIHRAENTDDHESLRSILTELHALRVPVVLPLHPRTSAAVTRLGLTELLDGLQVLDPLDTRSFLALAAHAAVIVSDSGGVQEECTVLKRPLIVVRRSTERPEAMDGFAVLTEPGEMISKIALTWFDDRERLLPELASRPSPYGDGWASQRIVTEVVTRFAA